jgi:glutamate-1-semialdehyde 2,1-aminomutase
MSPGFIVRGRGAHVWDPDGNEFIDWGMGLRSVILGHAYEPVLEAVRSHLELGSNFTRPHPIEVEFAELLTDAIPSAEMVKLAKNGSDVTTAAVKLARAYTGRDLVVRCAEQPFFSVDDWFIGDTACNSGIPSATRDLTKRFSYNNPESLEQVFKQYPGQVACVILEPSATEEPEAGFLNRVLEICEKNGAVLIFDEIITGLRWHPQGAQKLYGVTPHLSTFGKALGNGFAVSALVGRRDMMELGGLRHPRERVFLLSTTHGGEVHSIAAAKKTFSIFQEQPIAEYIWRIGGMLRDGLAQLSREFNIERFVRVSGVPCSPYQMFFDGNEQYWPALRTLYLQETIRHGVLIPYIAPSFSHTETDVSRTLDASRKALQVLRQAIDRGTTDGLLIGPAVKPVFRKFN